METPYLWSYSFPMKMGTLDNDYYFYEDGRILHVYDQTIKKINQEIFVDASLIPDKERQEMIKACPKELRPKILKLLDKTK